MMPLGGRHRASPMHRGPRGQKTRAKARILASGVQLFGVASERSHSGFDEFHARSRIDAQTGGRAAWVFLSSQNRPCLRAAEPVPALRWRALGSTSARPRLRLHPSSTFQAAKPEPSRTRAERARAAGPPSSQHSPRRSRRDNAPSTAEVGRGRPPRRPQEVDAGHHTSDGAGAGGAKAADGGAEGPEGAREA